MFALRQSDWRRGNARNVSLQTLYGGKFMFSTQLIPLKCPVILSHRRSTTVSLQTYPLYYYGFAFLGTQLKTALYSYKAILTNATTERDAQNQGS